MDGYWRQHFRQRQFGHFEYYRRPGGYDHDQRDLYRFARIDGFEYGLSDGRKSATAASSSQQAERMPVPEQDEAVARRQHLQSHAG